MDLGYGGGSWAMIANSNPATPSSSSQQQDHHQQQQQQQLYLQQQQQQFQSPPHQHFHHPSPQQLLRYQQPQQQNPHHQSLASHFHLLNLVEDLANVIDNGTRDQHSDTMVNELNKNFDKCQQLLNSISGSINTKAVTVEGQKRKVEESEQLLNQRSDLIAKYRKSVEELTKSEL
ncbi:hypothetical protein LguiA_028771 [Lonicera macranthoides]